jgi:uncharacterized protein
VLIRDLTTADLSRAWEINQANTPAVGDVTPERLAEILGMSSISLVAEVDDDVVGFCMVLPPDTTYSSMNYRWFVERYADFVYLDRVAIAESHQSRGIGAALYAEVERRAREAGSAKTFTLEVNLRPRNDGSLRFHERLGFLEVGQQETNYGVLVSMLAKPL